MFLTFFLYKKAAHWLELCEGGSGMEKQELLQFECLIKLCSFLPRSRE